MMTEHRRVAWLLVLILAAPGLAHAARQGRLVGKVVDTDGNPIAGVAVTATSPDIADFMEVRTTDKKGVFKVDFERLFVVYQYRFEKAGYVTTRAEQNWSYSGTKRHEFTMPRGEGPAADAPPPASVSTPAVVAFNAGFAAFEAEDYPTARAKLEEALGHDPDLRLAWEVLSQVHVAQGSYQEAAEAAEKAIALGSTEEAVLRARWEAYRNLGDEVKTAEAQEDLEKIDRLTEEAKAIYNEGVALTKAGDDEGAFAKFQEALDLAPNLQVALFGIAAASLKTDRLEEAAVAAETILKADPQNEQALRIRYNAYLKLKDEPRVAEALVGLAAVDPVVARDGLFQLATLAFEADETDRAKERLDLVLGIDPNHARAHYMMGLILIREDAKEEAASHLERFLELTPDDPDAETARGVLGYVKGS